jgi:hypothetical protein
VDDALIKKILIHLGLLDNKKYNPPHSNNTHISTIETDYTYSPLLFINYFEPIRDLTA